MRAPIARRRGPLWAALTTSLACTPARWTVHVRRHARADVDLRTG